MVVVVAPTNNNEGPMRPQSQLESSPDNLLLCPERNDDAVFAVVIAEKGRFHRVESSSSFLKTGLNKSDYVYSNDSQVEAYVPCGTWRNSDGTWDL